MTTCLRPSTVVDCSNPLLDIWTTLNGIVTDPVTLEWIIFDITNEAVPVQLAPAAGRFLVDAADCPTGQRLALGRYTALYTVPSGELVGKRKIRWFINYAGHSEFRLEQPFDITTDTVPTGETPATTAFRARFPIFADINQFPAELILLVLQEAIDGLDPLCFGSQLERAQQYYAAHLLAFVTDNGRLKTSVTAGPSSISWDAAKEGLSSTGFGQHYQMMARRGCGAQVLC